MQLGLICLKLISLNFLGFLLCHKVLILFLLKHFLLYITFPIVNGRPGTEISKGKKKNPFNSFQQSLAMHLIELVWILISLQILEYDL